MRAFLSLLVAGSLSLETGCAVSRQPPLSSPGISEEEKIVLGGWPQTIFIRGRNRQNPVLLFVHGGPGLPEMPFSHVNADLEQNFTMVYWDQRGAGKSYRPDIPKETITVNQLVHDTEELTRYLIRRFGQEKIYLAGFSAGSLVSLLAVSHHPEYYRAYIGISQLIDVPRSELLLHRAGIAEANARGFPEVARELHQIGEPPYHSRRDERRVNKITKDIQPRFPYTMTLPRYVWLGLQSPYYNLLDDCRILRGIRFSGLLLEKDIESRDLFKTVPEIDVPVWFFAGRDDTVLSQPLVQSYFRSVYAPRGKHFIWFSYSDHILHLEEDAKFRAELRTVLRVTR